MPSAQIQADTVGLIDVVDLRSDSSDSEDNKSSMINSNASTWTCITL